MPNQFHRFPEGRCRTGIWGTPPGQIRELGRSWWSRGFGRPWRDCLQPQPPPWPLQLEPYYPTTSLWKVGAWSSSRTGGVGTGGCSGGAGTGECCWEAGSGGCFWGAGTGGRSGLEWATAGGPESAVAWVLEGAADGGWVEGVVDGGVDFPADSTLSSPWTAGLGEPRTTALSSRWTAGLRFQRSLEHKGIWVAVAIGRVCGGSRRGVNWRIGRAGWVWLWHSSTLQSSHILTTVNDQIAHVIAKGSYSNHSMVVWSEFWVKVYYESHKLPYEAWC